jgi:predicted short-subunit dehydrogenase-like oxidoreductase (DUF2520 family)
MRQVPEKSIALIGNGRVSRHLSHYFNLLKIPHIVWSRDHSADFETAITNAGRILILISDSAIENFIEGHPVLKDRHLIHCSGSLVLKSALGFHPLMSFGEDLYDLNSYLKIPFVGESGRASFREIFPELPNLSFEIDPKLKPFYHSLCVMSGNFTTLLWQKLFSDFSETLNLPKEAALPYLERVFKNLMVNPSGSFTGPLQRKDQKTILANLKALNGDVYQDVYRAFVRATDNVIDGGQNEYS